MARRERPIERELASGQLLLFAVPESAPAAVPAAARSDGLLVPDADPSDGLLVPDADPSDGLPDPAARFDALNRQLFGASLIARVEWSERMTACAGQCRPEEGLIRISAPYHRRRPDLLDATLAHEMCHLVAPGHGPEFRRIALPIARALGLSWREFRYSERWADLRRYRYVYACPRCGLELPSRKRRRVSCGRCRPGVYDESYRLELVESRTRPGPVLRGERPARAP